MGDIWRSGLAALLFSIAGSSAAFALASDSAAVSVRIRVEPIAEITFPHGTGFHIVVPAPICEPDHGYVSRGRCGAQPRCTERWPTILPVRIPFVVKGNAFAVVSAQPDSFLRIRSGRYLGKATRPGGGLLGYHVILHFPVPDASYHWILDWTEWEDWSVWNHWAGYGRLPSWSNFCQLPGRDRTGTPSLKTNVASRGGTAYGVVYVVAAHDWTPDGHRADPGNYYGSIVITVTAAQQ